MKMYKVINTIPRILRTMYPVSIANYIVSVQPMDAPTGTIFNEIV